MLMGRTHRRINDKYGIFSEEGQLISCSKEMDGGHHEGLLDGLVA